MLYLHAGAHEIDLDGLRSVVTPDPTATHHPLPHHELVNQVEYALTYYGHSVVKRQFAIMPDGSRFFGILTLESDYGDYTDIVGLANSHNKTIPVSVCFGNSTFVCDNTAFSSEIVVKRKHTPQSRRQLPGIIQEIVEPMRQKRVEQNTMFDRYKAKALTDGEADQLIMQMFRRGIINTTRIPEVLGEWENPTCDYGDKTVYRLFSGTTWSLKPKVLDKPALTQDLHRLMDSVCTIDGELAAA